MCSEKYYADTVKVQELSVLLAYKSNAIAIPLLQPITLSNLSNGRSSIFVVSCVVHLLFLTMGPILLGPMEYRSPSERGQCERMAGCGRYIAFSFLYGIKKSIRTRGEE